MGLSGTNELLGLRKEGIRQAKEVLEILERLGHGVGQAGCLLDLAELFLGDQQLDAAEDAALRAIGLREKGG